MVKTVLNNIESNENYKGQIVKVFNIRKENYETFDFPEFVDETIKQKLQNNGIYKLYKHQLDAINLIKDGYNVVITSSTSSGKTLSFNIPILSTLSQDKHSTALYLYPTKALAQDQLLKLRELTDILAGTYDGDTPKDERTQLRNYGRIIVANPDILHVGILPNHFLWGKFLQNLKYVVIDEAHYYSGVLGSQLAMVMRRLRRVLSQYNAYPQFILSSATLENPEEFAFRLVGERFQLVEGPINPPNEKLFVIFNPELINAELNLRKNVLKEAVWVIEALLEQGKRVIVFQKSRHGVELLSRLLKERAGDRFNIVPYRAGYSKELRRNIESDLKNGNIDCIISTNALELGIDIGELDATVIVGYPGTISSLFQQSGRSGRQKESITIFIPSSNPLDQYFTKDPDYIFNSNFESISIDLENPYILKPHLLCAAYEVPILPESDDEYFGGKLKESTDELENEGTLIKKGERFFIDSKTSPAKDISLRSAGEENIKLIDMDSDKLLEKISKDRALEEAFVGAVYMHLSDTYVVKSMDLENKVVYLKKEDSDYYTDSLAIETIWIDKALKEKKIPIPVYFGEVTVEETIRGFVKKQFFTDKKIGTEPLDLPKITFKTKGLWFTLDDSYTKEVKEKDDFLGAVHAMEHSLVAMMPLIVQCDRNDVGGVSHPKHPDTDLTTIFLYDGIEGGIGITEKAYDRIDELLEAAYRSISTCPCKDGCPACIFSPKCGNENNPLSKSGAIMLLKEVLKRKN